MRRLIDYLRRDPIWWGSLVGAFLAAAVFAFFVVRSVDRSTDRTGADPAPTAPAVSDEAGADTADAGTQPDLTIMELDLSGLPSGVRHVAANVVSVIVQTANGSYIGNGTAIRPGIVLTANHVVDKGQEEIVIICDAKQFEAEILQQDFATDTAILKVPGCGQETLAVVPTRPDIGDVLYVTGFLAVKTDRPTIARQLHSTSRVPGARLIFTGKVAEETAARNLSAALSKRSIRPMALAGAQQQGMSGSPVFMADGRIIGMVSIADNARNRTFVIPAWVLERELLRAGIK